MSIRQRSRRFVFIRNVTFVVFVGIILTFAVTAGAEAAGFAFFGTISELFGSPTAVTDNPPTVNDSGRNSSDKVIKQPTGVVSADPEAVADLAQQSKIIVGHSYHNDTSPPLRDMVQVFMKGKEMEDEHEANKNPLLKNQHIDQVDTVVQSTMAPEAMPTPILSFDGVVFPGVACNCSPPDTDGEVGATQYVQMVNEGYQVFNKSTGASVLGPSSIVSLWAGFGGVCQSNGHGDPIVLYDQIAGRWLISQFAGASVPTDECIAVSTTSDATGSYNRYGFHLGSNFFDYPHLSVWPDGYYMADNVFNAAGTAFLGPQPFVFDRAAMLAGTPATFITPGITVGPSEAYPLPADLDGSALPPAGTPCPFVEFPDSGTYKTWLFHADFVTPANSTYTLRPSPPAAAGFTQLCPATRACVPNAGGGTMDGIGDRLMFRLSYRIVGGVERVVGNHTVSSGGVAGVRWFELRNVTSGAETVFQQSTYQPDSTWRWMGSAATDQGGNIAVGFSASSSSINPQIRYAGRLVGDPLNTLAQGETTLFAGTGSPTTSASRWGDYSDLTIDPVDDCTFWYTQEYFATTGSQFNWRTRIGNFKFPSCGITAPLLQPGTATLINESCVPANGVVDPGETVTVAFPVSNVGNINTTSDIGTLQNSGGVTAAGAAQNYGVIVSGGASVSRNFTFTADPMLTCGANITATVHHQDGAADLGNLVYTIPTGTVVTNTSFTQNFDGVTAPALPAGWTTDVTGAGVAWPTSTTNPDSAPNDAFGTETATVGVTNLNSAVIAVPAGSSYTLQFRNLYNLESGFDGEVLEIKIGAGAYTDILAAGGSFVSGGYNSMLSTGFSNPLPGRSAWSNLSGGTIAAPAYITSIVNLPAAASGQNIQLRWRVGSDSSVTADGLSGVRIDSISISTSSLVCSNCAVSTPTATATSTNTPTATPTATPNITGNVDYAIVSKPVANTKLDAAGSIPLMVFTDSMGNYSLSGFGGGAYTVTPSRTAQPCLPAGPNGIFANDAALISQHVVSLITLTPDQLIAADVSGLHTISSFDAALIAQKVVGICSGSNHSGEWVFSPASVPHPGGVVGSLTENYRAVMIGDVSGDWDPMGPQRPQIIRRFGVPDVKASVPVTESCRRR